IFVRRLGIYPHSPEIAQIAQQVAGETAQVLPGLVSSLLLSHPQVRYQTHQQAGFYPQAYGLQQAGVYGWPSFNPQYALFGFNRQQAFDPPTQALFGVGLEGQSDVAKIAQQVASAAIQALPGVISGLLSSHLQMRMQTAQWGGIAPQGIGTSFVGLPAMHPLQQQLLQQAVAQQLSQQTSQFGGLVPQ